MVSHDPANAQHGELLAVPAYVLWNDPTFRSALGQPDARLDSVELTPLSATTTTAIPTPSALLLARHEIVPWQPRTTLMRDLLTWADQPGPGVWLLHGPGGQGKTRLALQLSHELSARWAVFWPSPDKPAETMQIVGQLARPTLIVLDYAETRPTQLRTILTVLPATAQVKVLLLARTAAGWWEDLPVADERIADNLATARTHPLEPLPATEATYRDAITAYATALPQVPGLDHHPWADIAARLPDRDHLDHPLTLHLTALADLLDTTLPPEQRTPNTTPEARVLLHERRYWHKTAATIPALAALNSTTLHNVIALAILAGLTGPEDADPVLRTLPGLPADPNPTLHHLTGWLRSLYPPTTPGRYFDSPQPDRLAEHHAAHQTLNTPNFTNQLAATATADQATTMLTVLTRALIHTPHPTQLAHHITTLITTHSHALAPPALTITTQTETPQPLLTALHTITTNPDTPTSLVTTLTDLLPHSTRRLAHLATDLTQRLVHYHRTNPDAHLPDLAMSLNNLSNRLGEVGRREEG
ncbi:P-loop NTPase, partial [Actinokineospora spheciospongiae]|uniref:P-loop NTPase n=1 Tax=Actinokineospora spheciospongiae TaxID=909613 RepID=UPI00190F8AB6